MCPKLGHYPQNCDFDGTNDGYDDSPLDFGVLVPYLQSKPHFMMWPTKLRRTHTRRVEAVETNLLEICVELVSHRFCTKARDLWIIGTWACLQILMVNHDLP